MTLLLALGQVIPPQVPLSHGVGVFYKFVKRAMIPAVKSELYLHANLFGASDKSDALQYNQLKNDHPLYVPLLIPYAL